MESLADDFVSSILVASSTEKLQAGLTSVCALTRTLLKLDGSSAKASGTDASQTSPAVRAVAAMSGALITLGSTLEGVALQKKVSGVSEACIAAHPHLVAALRETLLQPIVASAKGLLELHDRRKATLRSAVEAVLTKHIDEASTSLSDESGRLIDDLVAAMGEAVSNSLDGQLPKPGSLTACLGEVSSQVDAYKAAAEHISGD